MVRRYVSLVLKICTLGLVISAGSFWAGARVDSRPKNKDEQTLVGGAIWSQILIPIGLMLSRTIEDGLDELIQGYFLFSGVALLHVTGFFLILRECLVVTRKRRIIIENVQLNDRVLTRELKFDKIYFLIGIFLIAAGILTFTDIILMLID